MDRDSTTNSLDSGANSSMNATDMTDGIHEASQQGEIAAGGTAKHMERGANSAMNATDLTDGIHEASHQGNIEGEKLPGDGVPAFSKDGAIGKAFTAQGAIGGIADKIGGPFAKEGFVGKEFTADGSIGGTVQENLGKRT